MPILAITFRMPTPTALREGAEGGGGGTDTQTCQHAATKRHHKFVVDYSKHGA
jgi:hypothetical protein